MKYILIVPHIDDLSTGPAHSVPSLTRSLSELGLDVELICLEPGRSVDNVAVKIFRNSKFIKRLGISIDMFKYLKHASKKGNVLLHNNSIWMFPNIYPGLLKMLYPNIKLILSPRGTLSEYALSISKWKKKIVWPLQKISFRYADCFHATGENEYYEIRKLGYKQPIAIIPNGVDIPILHKLNGKSKNKKLLYLGRIHKKKGLETLINCWSKLENKYSNWSLDIVGRLDSSYSNRIIDMAKQSDCRRINFVGELTGNEKNLAYQNADLFILPTHSENFGIVVAESLANSTPVIVTNNTPWGQINNKRVGWCVPNDEAIICNTMEIAFNSNELEEMGKRGRKWMKEDYSWYSIAVKMRDLYEWIDGKENKPDCVVLD
jgi:glycosyltransferase involved in cell wall biosynthesis